MSSIVLSGDTSGTVTISAPAIAGTNTMSLAAATGTLSPRVVSTAVATTSGTAFDYTSIPSWVTRITVMLNGVSLSGSDDVLIQIGSGSFTTSGYVSTSVAARDGTSTVGVSSTSGFIVRAGDLNNSLSGTVTIMQIDTNTWVSSHSVKIGTAASDAGGGNVTISGSLDRVRITRTGTNTFDAGSVNIVYE